MIKPMIHRGDSLESDVVRLIVTTREKFPHTPQWDAALKRVIWRYTGTDRPPSARRRRKSRRR